ncbi:hypothetical protein Tco_0719058 [Tanacetum coccineum]
MEIFGPDARPRPPGKTRPAKKTKSETTESSASSGSGSMKDAVVVESSFRNAHRQHGSYKEDGERSGGDLETNDSTLHGFRFQALQSAVHAFCTEKELQSHRAFKEELDQNSVVNIGLGGRYIENYQDTEELDNVANPMTDYMLGTRMIQ